MSVDPQTRDQAWMDYKFENWINEQRTPHLKQTFLAGWDAARVVALEATEPNTFSADRANALVSRLIRVMKSSDLEGWPEGRLAINDAQMWILGSARPVVSSTQVTPEGEK